MNDPKTTTAGKIIERLRELPANVTILNWGMMADNRFLRPKRKTIDTVESLIAWMRRFPKEKKIELFFVRMEDQLKYPMLLEFGLKETLNHQYDEQGKSD